MARSYTKLDPSTLASTSTFTFNTFDNWNLIEERDGRGAQQARYVHGRKIDEILVMINRHGTFYPHHDVLGNVTMLTGRDGLLVERYDYSVTGQVTISDATGKVLTASAVGNRWMFTGREWLQEVGLYDYRNRVYSAELGRFLQTDPIRFSAGDVNIYRYAYNRMVLLTDPTGLAPGDTFSSVSAAAADAGQHISATYPSEYYEHGTYIYETSNGSGSYTYTVPVTSYDPNGIADTAWGNSAPITTRAIYHNHTMSGTEEFSSEDQEFSEAIPLYMQKITIDGPSEMQTAGVSQQSSWWDSFIDWIADQFE